MRKTPCKDIQDVIARLTEENNRALQRLENNRRTVIRVLNQNDLAANRPTGAPTELASDEEGVLWIYDEGTWRPCCTYGEEVEPTGFGLINFLGFEPEDSETEIWVIDGDNPGTATRVAAVVEDFGWGRVEAVWSQDQSYLYASFQDYDFGTYDIIRMDPDGNNKTVMFTTPTFDQMNWPAFHVRGEDVYLSYTRGPVGSRSLKTFDVNTGTMIGSFPGSVVAGTNNPFIPQMSPTELRYCVLMTASGVNAGWHFIDIDGTNIVGPVGDDNGNPRYNPSGNGTLAYIVTYSPPTAAGVYMMNDDGTDVTFLGNPFDETSAFVPSWAPDGSQFAIVQDSSLVHIFSDSGSFLKTIDASPEWPYDSVDYWDWSLDSTKMIFGLADDDDNIWFDALDIETEEITRFYTANPSEIEFLDSVRCASTDSY